MLARNSNVLKLAWVITQKAREPKNVDVCGPENAR